MSKQCDTTSLDRISGNLERRDTVSPSLRPTKLTEFIGQSHLKNNLSVFIEAAKSRGEALDHVLFYGPPGLGKTTLSQIIANELGISIRTTAGPLLSKSGDLAAILTNLQEHDVLFIDEIHRLPNAVEEVLYPAMEDYSLDLVIGEGPGARMMKLKLPKFTLIGATTRLGLLTNPLRDRFGIHFKLDFYSVDELIQVVKRCGAIYDIHFSDVAALELAKCARGTPRIAARLVKRVRDFVSGIGLKVIEKEHVKETLQCLNIDHFGLDAFDRKYIAYIYNNYKDQPVGIETIAAGLSEDKGTLEDTVEPYLLQIGFITRTPKGRVITSTCVEYIQQM
ncbi:Holliday junction branch migration DNA helicase RuvB [Rickettsiales endosymbiont of Peranema trichophorum]|uniref:Holliday junction branch migration DNA helicase RuvB n=1 Tax=Rickettsiales endosymbiont of Peranema trichophorum TaxID=2486577 RepID=UPI0010237223|nr:Holliday junction branch migration DNA helicase RuvB [Rickettsiales endosymbiont of Peranema trichophorum]RZI47803.1 Holliday junction branch migration DNA helicase RuvB [Rickettsiales endosymbiont of Peranema trichophorum]